MKKLLLSYQLLEHVFDFRLTTSSFDKFGFGNELNGDSFIKQ